jgi:transposase-like protein
MASNVLSAPHFQNEAAAFAYVEARLWPNGPVCHHCGETERIGRLQGKTTRPGLYKCYACRKPFTVRMGTIFESSHLPLHLWLQIIHLMCASKKGISTHQIQRMRVSGAAACLVASNCGPLRKGWKPIPRTWGRGRLLVTGRAKLSCACGTPRSARQAGDPQI